MTEPRSTRPVHRFGMTQKDFHDWRRLRQLCDRSGHTVPGWRWMKQCSKEIHSTLGEFTSPACRGDGRLCVRVMYKYVSANHLLA